MAAEIGARLQGGEAIELVSDLGGGKTAFVRGLARGMGSNDTVGSPSFTISKEYDAGKLRLYHYDFYRLQDAGIMANELAEAIADPLAVVAVEWGSIVASVMPIDTLRVTITKTGDDSRMMNFSAGGQASMRLKGGL